MMVHNYLFSQKIEKDGKFINEGIEFNMLFPVEKNEGAPKAMETLNALIPVYLKKIEKTVPAFDIEYIGTQKTDKFQDKIIVDKGYTVIPSLKSTQEVLDK